MLTEVPAIAKSLEDAKCGIVCEYDEDDVVEKTVSLLLDTRKLKTYSENAKNFAKEYDWNKIFADAFSKSLS